MTNNYYRTKLSDQQRAFFDQQIKLYVPKPAHDYEPQHLLRDYLKTGKNPDNEKGEWKFTPDLPPSACLYTEDLFNRLPGEWILQFIAHTEGALTNKESRQDTSALSSRDFKKFNTSLPTNSSVITKALGNFLSKESHSENHRRGFPARDYDYIVGVDKPMSIFIKGNDESYSKDICIAANSSNRQQGGSLVCYRDVILKPDQHLNFDSGLFLGQAQTILTIDNIANNITINANNAVFFRKLEIGAPNESKIATIDTLNMYKSRVYEQAVLKNCTITHNLEGTKAYFGGDFGLFYISINGTLALKYSAFDDRLLIRDVRVGKDFLLADAKIIGRAYFVNCIFEGSLDFSGADFENFVLFKNCVCQGDVILDNCHFATLPDLRGLECKRPISLTAIRWPDEGALKAPIKRAIKQTNSKADPIFGSFNNYIGIAQHLKRLAIQNHDATNELDFFALELFALTYRNWHENKKGPLLKRIGATVAYGAVLAYEFITRSGRSFERPIIIWLGLMLLAGCYYSWQFDLFFSTAFGASFKASLPFWGGDITGLRYTGFAFTAHKIVASILLFLTGLGLRNRFRIG